MEADKLNFLRVIYPEKLKAISPTANPLFGKMNVQLMIEHMSDSVREANGTTKRELITPADKLEAFRNFILSEKEFRPNTKNALMGEEPLPVRNNSVSDAIDELKNEINDFVNRYKDNPEEKIMNPFFGPLNFYEWTHLLHKHAIHHLKQFNVEV